MLIITYETGHKVFIYLVASADNILFDIFCGNIGLLASLVIKCAEDLTSFILLTVKKNILLNVILGLIHINIYLLFERRETFNHILL